MIGVIQKTSAPIIEELEIADGGNERGNEGDGERGFATVALRDPRHEEHPEKGADILENGV
ncbi:MAG: hypothetical protein WDN28_33590 [Chthoniobacter sp.]